MPTRPIHFVLRKSSIRVGHSNARVDTCPPETPLVAPMPRPKISLFKSSFAYDAVKVFNSLPLKIASSITTFKGMMEMVRIAQMEIVRIAKKGNSSTITLIVELFPFFAIHIISMQLEPFPPFPCKSLAFQYFFSNCHLITSLPVCLLFSLPF